MSFCINQSQLIATYKDYTSPKKKYQDETLKKILKPQAYEICKTALKKDTDERDTHILADK